MTGCITIYTDGHIKLSLHKILPITKKKRRNQINVSTKYTKQILELVHQDLTEAMNNDQNISVKDFLSLRASLNLTRVNGKLLPDAPTKSVHEIGNQNFSSFLSSEAAPITESEFCTVSLSQFDWSLIQV